MKRLLPFVEIVWKKDWCSKWYCWTIKLSAISCFTRWLSVCRSVLHVSQITEAFHRFSPPLFCNTRLNQKCRGPFFYPTDCALNNSVGFWSVWSWLVVFPTQVFTKFHGIICVTIPSFWSGGKNFCKRFIVSRTVWTQRRIKILHHDGGTMPANEIRFLFIENFMIRRYRKTNVLE